VAALGASSYTWAEATRDMQMESWLRCHVHTSEHFHGIPALAVPDNTKTGVTKAHRYDPDLNPTYYNFALHCGRSTILTSQLPVARWHEQIGDPTAADGILDRLVHNAHRLEMRGDSMRKNRGKPNA